MDEVKSALEIALEKAGKIGEATEEERLKWKYVPEGEKLAARYLKDECNLVAELSRYNEKARKYVIKGAEDIVTRHITLPKDDFAERNNRRAMEGLKIIKTDKVKVENIYSAIRRIFNHYMNQGKQQKLQAHESLKAEFGAKLQQAMQQQMGPVIGLGYKIDVERQPQFQEEWHRLQAQLDSQYLKLLDEYKQGLLAIS